MTAGASDTHDPPPPPATRRRVALYRFQLIGLPLLLAIPLLALLNVFGERWTSVRADQGSLDVSLRYPAVFRYKMIDAIDLHVRNRGGEMIDTVTVTLDTTYAGRFSTVTAIPPFTGPFEIDLPHVAAGETRRVRIEIQAERYWSHSGPLTVATRTDTVRVPLTTLVFP